MNSALSFLEEGQDTYVIKIKFLQVKNENGVCLEDT